MNKLNKLSKWLLDNDFKKESLCIDNIILKSADACSPPFDKSMANEIRSGATLKPGAKGPQVGYLQTLLENNGYTLDNFGIDCDFGDETESMLRMFQIDNNLNNTGILDPNALYELELNLMLGYTRPTDENVQFMYNGKVYDIATIHPSGSKFRSFENSNWRYRQPKLGELKWFIERGGVTSVVRMNGDGGDTDRDPQAGLSISMDLEEQFVNGHIGYQRGRGYVGTLNRVLPYLERGNTLIHCHGGRDRTGFTVAAFRKQFGLSNEELWDYTVDFNSWEKHICRSADDGYAKYLDGFYPLNEFCNHPNHRGCAIC
jgi:hypothetical protein